VKNYNFTISDDVEYCYCSN